ncbi:transporter substrate-binding domain-containing protein [Rhodopila sp.]|uniref:transporter substrate-binding domain-containing protein n=1 Tax=Rhodopila sp. TaxID=2480087 RepID=UPI003D0C300B
MRLSRFLLAIAFLPASAPVGVREPLLDMVLKRDKIIVDTHGISPLPTYVDDHRGRVGFKIDMAHEIVPDLLDDPNKVEPVITQCNGHFPAVLSGRIDFSQRSGKIAPDRAVRIARTPAMDPKIMRFDEVTSALDLELVNAVLAAMRQLERDSMTDRIISMDGGLIIGEGMPDYFCFQPSIRRVRQFLKRCSDRYRL